jgi:hypothetical protein
MQLKKDYISGYGDTIDLVVIAAAWEKDRARELRGVFYLWNLEVVIMNHILASVTVNSNYFLRRRPRELVPNEERCKYRWHCPASQF